MKPVAPGSDARVAYELKQAERWMRTDPRERRLLVPALSAALLLHALLLWAHLPDWGPAPTRIEAPAQVMKVQFLRPPPPPPKVEPRPPEPKTKKIPRPEIPDEPEPLVVPLQPPPPIPEEPMAPGLSPQPLAPAVGPIRVEPGQGPGLIKKVEPIYPALAKVARIQGTVVLDAVILQDGSVDRITVLRSANEMLNNSAIEALKQWRFTPGQQDVIMTLTVNFVLKR
jgi:protein TonB